MRSSPCFFVLCQVVSFWTLPHLATAQLTESNTQTTHELDVSWDFDDNQDTLGWGNSTAEEMNMEVRAENGELRCSIIGLSPKLESPRLFLNVSNRHFIIMRAKYAGAAQDARLLLRSGGAPSPNKQLVLSTSYWTERQIMVPISSSPPHTSSTSNFTISTRTSEAGDEVPYYDMTAMVDGQLDTFYLSSASMAAQVVLDLKSHRWVTALRINPVGDNRSPKRCLLQASITSGVGPFETVKAFTVRGPVQPYFNASDSSSSDIDMDSSNSTTEFDYEEQRFGAFSGYARYWRLILLDNYGGDGIGIRELHLDGYDETVTPVPFKLRNTGVYETYYLPINTYLSGMLLRLRLELVYNAHNSGNDEVNPNKGGKIFREGLFIDHIRIARAPEVWKVRGCLDKYYRSANYEDPEYNVTSHVNVVNGNLPIRFYSKNNLTLQYASTYNCPLQGGAHIVLEGINFGMHPKVIIGGNNCRVTRNQVKYR